MNDTSVKTRERKAFDALKSEMNYSNPMEVPRLEKIVVSSGIGSIQDKEKIALIQDGLARITGQKPAPRQAKKSIATFKVREGDVTGYQVTLRGGKMYGFLDKLIHVALPRTKDFRGISRESIDDMGNITIGVSEHTVFPETSDEELKNVFGMAITIVTSAQDKEGARAFLAHIGVPFKKEEGEGVEG